MPLRAFAVFGSYLLLMSFVCAVIYVRALIEKRKESACDRAAKK